MSRGLSLAALLVCLLLAALDQTAVATALPTIAADLGTQAALPWVMSAYLLTAAVSTPIWGKLSDLHGRKPLLQAALGLFILGSLGAGMASGVAALVIARGVQGIGGGGMAVLVFAAVADLVPPRERGRYVGLFGAAFGLASVLGPVVGGVLTQAFSWRWIFYLNLPLGLLAMLAIAMLLHLERPRGRGSVDWRGATLLVVAVSGILLALLGADPSSGWPRAAVGASFAIGLVAAALFVRVERSAAEPLLPGRVLGNRVVRITASLGFVVGLTTIVTIVYAPSFLQSVLGSSPGRSGVQLLPFVAGTLVSSIVVGRLVSRTGRYRAYPIAGTAVSAVGLLTLSRLDTATAYPLVALGLTLVGIGLGCVIPVITVAGQSAVEHADVGVVTSTSALARALGSATGATAFGLVWVLGLQAVNATTAGASTSPSAVATATSAVFLWTVPLMLVAVVLAVRLPAIALRSRATLAPTVSPGD